MLSINKISREDHGNYVCHAENSFGTNKTAIQLTVTGQWKMYLRETRYRDVFCFSTDSLKCFILGLPDPPLDPKVPSVGSKTVELEWKSPFDGNDPIKKYIIQYKNAEGKFLQMISWKLIKFSPNVRNHILKFKIRGIRPFRWKPWTACRPTASCPIWLRRPTTCSACLRKTVTAAALHRPYFKSAPTTMVQYRIKVFVKF